MNEHEHENEHEYACPPEFAEDERRREHVYRGANRLGHVLVHVLVLVLVQPSSAQPLPLLRTGFEIDADEIAYFGLFPDAEDPRSATVALSDTGMTIIVSCGTGVVRHSLSACEAEVFARCLDLFERMGEEDSALAVLGRALSDPARQRCFSSFMRKRVFAFQSPQENEGRVQRLVLRDGTLVEGMPLAVTDSRIAMWTGGAAYDHRRVDSALVIVELADVDSVRGSFYTNSPAHGWLAGIVSGGLIMYAISEEQRNVYDGPGGTGTTVLPFPIALLLSGAVSILPGIVVSSMAGEMHHAVALDRESSEDLLEDLGESVMLDPSPPEVQRAMDAVRSIDPLANVNPESPVTVPLPRDTEGAAAQMPDLEVGIGALFNLYSVRARPFGVLPAIWAGKEIPLLRHRDKRPLLSLYPRAGYGLLHAAAGAALFVHAGPVQHFILGFDFVWNRDELGRFRLELGDGGGVTETARFVDDDWMSNAFVTFGFGFGLSHFRVRFEMRWGLAPAIIVHHHDHGWYNPGSERPDYETGPNAYGGFGLSIAYPILF
jgi:hypothetical protein